FLSWIRSSAEGISRRTIRFAWVLPAHRPSKADYFYGSYRLAWHRQVSESGVAVADRYVRGLCDGLWFGCAVPYDLAAICFPRAGNRRWICGTHSRIESGDVVSCWTTRSVHATSVAFLQEKTNATEVACT